jgi:hypothetical protein
MRFFIRGALFAPANPDSFPEDSKFWCAQYGQGVQIRFPNTEMQCFVFPEREENPV